MATKPTIIKRLNSIEAMASLLIKEATGLRVELGLATTPTPRKGKPPIQEKIAKIIARRHARILTK